jgi:orotate phosphoribosyltransferase
VVSLPRLIAESGAFKTGSFTLSSGEESPYYVDMKEACADPAILSTLAQHATVYAVGHDAVAGTALGGVPLAVALGLEAGRDTFLVRSEAKAHGTEGRLEGPVAGDERVLLVEDVATTGGSLVDAVRAVRGAGCTVDHAVTIVDREAGARQALGDEDVALHALVTLSELTEAHPEDDA